MALTHFDGTVTSDGTEQNLFDISTGGPKHFATWIFTHNMLSTHTITVRVYVEDENATTERKYIDTEISGAQTSPAFFVPFIPSDQYRVSIQRTAGTNIAITWVRAEA